jgi:thiol-disulfide isomerase/thioredoxin
MTKQIPNTLEALLIRLTFFVMFSLLSIIHATAQGFDLNDPNIIYKSSDGTTMMMDSVKKFVSTGNFSMTKRELGEGKIEVTLQRVTEEDVEQDLNSKDELIRRWINKEMPDFNLKTLAGASLKKSDLLGKVVVINFWFTGCQPCISEMPDLNKLVEMYSNKSVLFLAFSFNDKPSIERLISKHDFSYQHVPGSITLIKEMGINSYPTHLILDQNAKITAIEIGAFKNIYERLRNSIDKILEIK